MTFGQKIHALRVENHLTQEQVSVQIHVSRTCYANYEGGRRIPSYSVIVLLADLYHVSVDYLIRDCNEP